MIRLLFSLILSLMFSMGLPATDFKTLQSMQNLLIDKRIEKENIAIDEIAQQIWHKNYFTKIPTEFATVQNKGINAKLVGEIKGQSVLIEWYEGKNIIQKKVSVESLTPPKKIYLGGRTYINNEKTILSNLMMNIQAYNNSILIPQKYSVFCKQK